MLRRRGLRTASVYGGRLASDRRKELRRVLNLALDLSVPEQVVSLLEDQLSETSYLPSWWTGLWTEAGLPMAKATASDLRQAKAAAEEDVWLSALRRYAQTRAGNEIRVVTGTWKDSLVKLARAHLESDLGIGIEKLTKKIYADYVSRLEKWQVRRIAQTEAMIGMADASELAAETLDVPYVKQWCISGLGNTRPSHEAVDGVTVDQDEPFVLEGGMLMYPHDTSLGASASEIINCACDCIRRPKTSSALKPSTKPQTPPAPAPAPEPAPAPVVSPRPVQAPTPAAPAVTPAAPPVAATTLTAEEERRVLAIMADYPAEWSAATRRSLAENDLKLEKKLGVKKGKPMDIEKADKQSANPNWKADEKPHQVNCATCAPTYAMREKGYDVIAKGCVKGSGSLNEKVSHDPWLPWRSADGSKVKPSTFQEWMKAKEYKTMTSARYKEFFDEFCKDPGTYELVLNWKGKGGHAMIIKRLPDGSLVGIEPQKFYDWRGSTFKLDFAISGMKSTPDFRCGVLKLDDKTISPDWAGLFETKK